MFHSVTLNSMHLFIHALGHSQPASEYTDRQFVLVSNSTSYWSAHNTTKPGLKNVPSV